MTRFIRHFIAICFIIAPFSLSATSVYSEKMVQLSAGQVSLSILLKNISAQTACVFSYDPVKINDKQLVAVPAGLHCSLSVALRKLLPGNIRFRFKDKFIVLQKVSTVVKEVPEQKPIAANPVKPIVEPLHHAPIVVDSLPPIPVVKENVVMVSPDPIVEIPPVMDTAVVAALPEAVVAEVLPVKSHQEVLVKKSSRGFGGFIGDKGILELELAGYSKQLGGAIHLGLCGFYVILSLGKNADKARSSGVGIGAAFKVHRQLGLSLDVLRLNLLSGLTYDLGVRTVTTQFRPELNYYLGRSCKLFAGPTFNMRNSTYVNSIRTYDLGKIFYYGSIIGVKVDINNLF